MTAKIISITRPLGDLAHLTPEQLIVFKARVSSPQNQDKHDTGERLLRYCLTNGHWSVFEMVDVTFEIETSRAVMAQVLRHHSFRFQEFSQRYSEVEAFDFSDLEIRMKHDGGNRQGSGELDDRLSRFAQFSANYCMAKYFTMLTEGAAPESARMVLPLATPTRAYMKGSIRSWITYLWQRLDAHAQKEHCELAKSLFTEFQPHFPVISQLIKGGRMQYVVNHPTQEP